MRNGPVNRHFALTANRICTIEYANGSTAPTRSNRTVRGAERIPATTCETEFAKDPIRAAMLLGLDVANALVPAVVSNN